MTQILCLTTLMLVSIVKVNGQSRPIVGQQIPWPPATGTTYFIVTPAPGTQPHSLQELCQTSSLIISGTVETIPPVRVLIKSERLETDVVVHLNRIVKGEATTSRVVVTQRGGVLGGYVEKTSQYSAMHVGEQYLLFLTEDKRPNIPVMTGIPRYWIAGEWVGNFRVDSNHKIHLSSAAPASLTERYENMSEESLMAEVAGLLKP